MAVEFDQSYYGVIIYARYHYAMTKEEKTNSCFLSIKKGVNSPLCIDKVVGFLCIMMEDGIENTVDNGIGAMGGNGLGGEHDDDEDMTAMGWDVRVR